MMAWQLSKCLNNIKKLVYHNKQYISIVLKKTTLLIICFIIFPTILGIILYQNTRITRANTSNFIKIENLKLELSELSYLRKIEIQSENISFANIKAVDINKDTINIKKIIKDEFLILRIFENFCSSCVEENLYAIDSLLNDKPVIILGSFYNFAAYKYFAEQYELNNCYMIMDNPDLNSILTEKYKLMYYMKLSENMKTDFVHVSLKGFIHYTHDYLIIVKDKLTLKENDVN